MTIAGAYVTREGVVLGADSTWTVSRGGAPVQLLNHAQKVFEIGVSGRMCLCTWGEATFTSSSHRMVVARLAEEVERDRLSVEQAANRLAELVAPLARSRAEEVGYFIGGISPHGEPQCYQVLIGNDEIQYIDALELGAHFNGRTEFYERVVRGYDPTLATELLREIRSTAPGLAGDFDWHFEAALARTAKLLAAVGAKELPIREAIDYVYYHIFATIKAFKFKFGVPICGGPIEIGFVTADRPFRWVAHKDFDAAMLEDRYDYSRKSLRSPIRLERKRRRRQRF